MISTHPIARLRFNWSQGELQHPYDSTRQIINRSNIVLPYRNARHLRRIRLLHMSTIISLCEMLRCLEDVPLATVHDLQIDLAYPALEPSKLVLALPSVFCIFPNLEILRFIALYNIHSKRECIEASPVRRFSMRFDPADIRSSSWKYSNTAHPVCGRSSGESWYTCENGGRGPRHLTRGGEEAPTKTVPRRGRLSLPIGAQAHCRGRSNRIWKMIGSVGCGQNRAPIMRSRTSARAI